MNVGGKQQAAAPGLTAGPGPQAGSAAAAGRSPLARLATRTAALLRLVGSRCCVGQADTAWRRTVDRDLGGTDRE